MLRLAVENLTHRLDVRAAFPKRLIENQGDWRKRLSREDCVRAASLTANNVKIFTKCQQMRLYGGDRSSCRRMRRRGIAVDRATVSGTPTQAGLACRSPGWYREPTHNYGTRNGDGEGEPVS